MSWVAVAIGGSSLISAGANAYGAKKANDAAANNAAVAQQNIGAANQAVYDSIDPARSAWEAGAKLGDSYLTNGYNEVMQYYDQMAPLYGEGMAWMRGAENPNIDPNVAQHFDPGEYEQSPGYQHQLKEGLAAVQNSAAAEGGLYSGNTLEGITDYATGLAAQDYGNWHDRKMREANYDQGVDVGNYQRAYGQGMDDRNFEYGRGQDLANIGLDAIGTQADLTGNLWGNRANMYGGVQDRYGNLLVDSGRQYAQNFTNNAGIQASTPYVSPWGAVSDSLQGGIENYFRYRSMNPGGGDPGSSYGMGSAPAWQTTYGSMPDGSQGYGHIFNPPNYGGYRPGG